MRALDVALDAPSRILENVESFRQQRSGCESHQRKDEVGTQAGLVVGNLAVSIANDSGGRGWAIGRLVNA